MLAKYRWGEEGMNRGEKAALIYCPNWSKSNYCWAISANILLIFQQISIGLTACWQGGGGKRQVLGLLHRIGTKRTFLVFNRSRSCPSGWHQILCTVLHFSTSSLKQNKERSVKWHLTSPNTIKSHYIGNTLPLVNTVQCIEHKNKVENAFVLYVEYIERYID
jgi:hypothetical protein